jgi:UDP-N-acetylglucosamine--N-acetylmuramyl-(pentapeptide) pyrophosphoryl-undecaprenol N-acetylglucosamine transferase
MTGGGTSGHVTPNLALVPQLLQKGFTIEYIGSKDGIEKKLVEQKKIFYHGISTGKLRRYLSLKNISDIFKILYGVIESYSIIKKNHPDIIFSKGGFVAVPVVLAAWLNRIPVIIHESDITMGLANKISLPFAKVICTSFQETANNITSKKTIVTGPPIRYELFNGNKERARKFLKLDQKFYSLPVLLVMGGSLGSVCINKITRECLHNLTGFIIIHICGKGNKKNISQPNYFEFEYLDKELPDFFCLADIIVSRAGSNSIFEFLFLNKPNLLIPLSKKSSRGDQILNAVYFKKMGFSKIIFEEDLTKENFINNIDELYKERMNYKHNMSNTTLINGNDMIINQIVNVLNTK